ncbi:MAG: class I SAM-dependent methyltransferase [Pirellulales bacterium]|jgi:23S rRNA (cytosine1962-C5)-methyltransferase
MFTPDQYEVLDFGQGRKLERVGAYLLDRMSPAAEQHQKSNPALWKQADAQYLRTSKQSGIWQPEKKLPEQWTIKHRKITFEIKPTQFGHLGIFPEQAENWDWIEQMVEQAGRPLKVLNLFAYTGGSTLAAAVAGAELTHVDAAKSVVNWARTNAGLSGLAAAPIRWITEDAVKFVKRELKRGNRYDAVILDPPTYGHGAGGQVWRFEDNIDSLLSDLAQLTNNSPHFILLTGHTLGYGPKEMQALLTKHFRTVKAQQVESRALSLTTSSGLKLSSGMMCRWVDHQKKK